MRLSNAAVLLVLAFLALAPCAPAGDPLPAASLQGRTFDIAFITEKGKPHEKLIVDGEGAACTALGAAKVPLVCKYHDKKGKVIDFSGKLTDAKGTVIEVSGSVSGTEIHGSITITPKDDDPKARNFSGAQLASK